MLEPVDARLVSKPQVLAATIGASAMAFIDGSVVQIALPALQADLRTDLITLQWVITLYSLLLGALVLVGGALGDIVGRRRVFVAGTSLFVVASVLCGVAWSATALIAFRALQGLGAALMVPQSLAILAAVFPESERGRAIGTWSGASALTTALGPPLGGLLVDHLSWRAAFLVNVPLGLVVLWLAIRAIPESRTADAPPIDWPGGGLATLALGSLTFALVSVPEHGSGDVRVLGSLAFATIAGVLFVAREFSCSHPMMPLSLFRDPVFAGINAATLLLYGALSGALFLLPYALISYSGFSAAEAGLATLPLGIIIGVLSRYFGRLADRIGAKSPMTAGSTLVALALLALAWAGLDGNPWLSAGGPIVALSLGMAAVVAPLTSTIMGSVPADRSGIASGINNAAARTAGLLAVALTTALTTSVFTAYLARSLDGVVEPAARTSLLAGSARLLEAPLPADLGVEQRQKVQSAMRKGFARAFTDAMLMQAILAGVAAVLCITLPLKEQSRK